MNLAPPDRRLLFANDRVAHESLSGSTDRPLRAARPFAVGRPVVDLVDEGAPRIVLRQAVWGEAVDVLEVRDGRAFVRLARDGYVGSLDAADLVAADGLSPDARVSARETILVAEPDMKLRQDGPRLSYGTLLAAGATVRDPAGPVWQRVGLASSDDEVAGYLPATHLAPIDRIETDACAVARTFLGAPYVWGGNTGWGIDCSGLIQAALLACRIACPGDSDQQRARFEEPGRRGDFEAGELLFWKGHVAMALDAHEMIHANAHHMATVIEPIAEARQRIEGATPLLARGRPSRRSG